MAATRLRNAQTLGVVLYQARQDAGLTQAELAHRLGVSKQLIWDAENGQATKAIDRLFAMCEELGVELSAVIPQVTAGPATEPSEPS